jgi:hypothetical protein
VASKTPDAPRGLFVASGYTHHRTAGGSRELRYHAADRTRGSRNDDRVPRHRVANSLERERGGKAVDAEHACIGGKWNIQSFNQGQNIIWPGQGIFLPAEPAI